MVFQVNSGPKICKAVAAVIVLRVDAGARPVFPFLEKITAPFRALSTVNYALAYFSCGSFSRREYAFSIFWEIDCEKPVSKKKLKIAVSVYLIRQK